MYFAVFIDLYSRLLVGWALGARIDASLVTTAFAMACVRRRPKTGLIVHTNQGVQYTSKAFTKTLQSVRAVASISRCGCCWDNAVAESFCHSLQVGVIFGSRFHSRKEMQYEVFDYIERFYNRVPKHSQIRGISPPDFEN